MDSIAVLLVDDHRLVREALRDALTREQDIHVVGEADDGEQAVALIARVRPDVVVLDISLPHLSGIDVCARLRRTGIDAKIIALSGYTDRRFVTEMLAAGANGYITKSAAGYELIRAIRTVAGGQAYLSPELAGALVCDMLEQQGPRLGRREREVLRLIAEGRRSSEIASCMNISVATVEVHRRNINRKLGLRTVAELTRYAVREGIVEP